MTEWIINKLVFYSKNKMRYRFKILSYVRRIILHYYDPIIQIRVGNELLYSNFSHQLPIYLAENILYDRALPRIIKYLGNNKKLNIVDVGGNIGDTIALIKSSNKNVDILCVEGNEIYSSLLKKNYSNDCSVFIEECFCSDVVEVKNINLKTNSGTATININVDLGHKVNFLTLDEIVKKYSNFLNIDFIKVDTDGFDYKVLRGAIKILRHQQPFVFFELDKTFLSKNSEKIMSIFDLFEENKYEAFILYDNYGYLIGLFNFTQLAIVEDIILYMYNKKMYLDVLMIKDMDIAKDLYEFENKSIKSVLKS